jgi:hypothetical protein
MLLIAAVLGWGAFNWTHNAKVAGERTGLGGFISRLTNEQGESENLAVKLGVGAGIFGFIALIILASGGGGGSTTYQPPQNTSGHHPSAQAPYLGDAGSPRASQGSVEERLAKLRDMRDKGLLSQQEYDTTRLRILDDL